MNGTPQVGESCQYVKNGSGGAGDEIQPGVLKKVNGDGTVFGKVDDGSLTGTAMPYVAPGGTAPASGTAYIQALL